MMRIKLERFYDGDFDNYIAYGYDPDGRPLVLRDRRSSDDQSYPESIWVDFDIPFSQSGVIHIQLE